MTMKRILLAFLVLGCSLPVLAGEVHGKLTCKGSRDCAEAVVYVSAIPGKTFPAPEAHAKMNQLNMTFMPHVLPVLVGTTVDFLNSDAVLHNVFTPDACAEKFNLGTWPKGQSKSFTFKKECAATLLCKVHPEMEAFVVAVPTPFFAVAKADGSYAIADVPDGAATLKVWHPKLKAAARPVTVGASTEANFDLAR
jgi:plastocyanin